MKKEERNKKRRIWLLVIAVMIALVALVNVMVACKTYVKSPSEPALPPPKVTEKMTLYVLFDVDKATFREGDEEQLQKAVAFVKKYPGAKISVDGYTDSVGTKEYNLKLSELRATAVKDYLIKEAGIDSSKIKVVGHGEADPVADNKTAEGRAKNRRVDVSILSE